MQRQRGELVPIGEVVGGLGGPVQAVREARVVGKMLRFYTLGRADEAAIDEVLAVEEYVFPFDGADVLQQREVHAC